VTFAAQRWNARAKSSAQEKPFSVVMSLEGFQQVDCEVIDVGHADRILLIATPKEVLEKLDSNKAKIANLVEVLEGVKRYLGNIHSPISPSFYAWNGRHIYESVDEAIRLAKGEGK
jgi:hypothetical protein